MPELHRDKIAEILIDYNLNLSNHEWKNKESVLFKLRAHYGDCIDKNKAGLIYDEVNALVKKEEREKE